MRIQTETGQRSTSRPATCRPGPRRRPGLPCANHADATATSELLRAQRRCARRPNRSTSDPEDADACAGRSGDWPSGAGVDASRTEPTGSPTNHRFGEPTPPRLPSRNAPATWPVRGSTSSSESSSPTCSMNSGPTRRHSSNRGRREISFRTWCFGSTTPSRHQGLSFRVRGPDSPNDEEERSQVRSFPGWLQRSGRDRHEVFSESVGCGAFPPSTSSLSTTRMCAEPTAVDLERTRPRRMRLYGATSVAHDGSSRGGYATQGSSSSGRGRTVSSEPGPGDPRFASSDVRANCCSVFSVVRARQTLRSVGQPPPSKPSGMRGSACEIVLGEFLGARRGSRRPQVVRKSRRSALIVIVPQGIPCGTVSIMDAQVMG